MTRSLLAGLLAGAAALGPAAGAAASELEVGTLVVYRAGEAVLESQLSDIGPAEGLGGTVLEGDPRLSARIDHVHGGVVAGVFQATRGTARVRFPFTEHATILAGEVRLTDHWGNSRTLKPGDAYLIRQGSEVLWEVEGARVQKTFLNRTEAADSPAPMIVYEAHDDVSQSQLVDLGDPEGLGATVISGDPRISARVDHADGPGTAGVFQATRGDAQIRFPFTEHATVLSGHVDLTDENGQHVQLGVGDSYLVREGSSVLWELSRNRMQKSFFNVVEG